MQVLLLCHKRCTEQPVGQNFCTNLAMTARLSSSTCHTLSAFSFLPLPSCPVPPPPIPPAPSWPYVLLGPFCSSMHMLQKVALSTSNPSGCCKVMKLCELCHVLMAYMVLAGLGPLPARKLWKAQYHWQGCHGLYGGNICHSICHCSWPPRQ